MWPCDVGAHVVCGPCAVLCDVMCGVRSMRCVHHNLFDYGCYYCLMVEPILDIVCNKSFSKSVTERLTDRLMHSRLRPEAVCD